MHGTYVLMYLTEHFTILEPQNVSIGFFTPPYILTRPNLSQFWSFMIRRTTLIPQLCKIRRSPDVEAQKAVKGPVGH